MYKRLSSEVSVTEMLRMREDEHMSNTDIAASLGISPMTVYRYIGKQGKEIHRTPVRNGQPKPYREPGQIKEEAPACLVVADKEIALEGMVGHYNVAPKHKSVKICMADGSGMKLDFEKFSAFVDEVNAIKRKLDDLKFENEMW